MSVPRRPWQPRQAVAAGRSRLIAISKGAGIATLVLFVVTGASVAGIIGSNQHHGVTPAAAAGLPNSSSSVSALDPDSSTSAASVGTIAATTSASKSGAGVVLAIAQPKSQGQPGVVPVPLAPHATAGPIPLLAWEAYHRAAAGSGCKLPWYVLAGIGKIESNHGRYGGAQFDVTGTVHPAIFGPPTAYGRAMGPMQFIPPTWASYATDGNNDDVTNPQNIFDATKAAAHYLCKAGGPDLSGLAAQRRAVFAYNHLDSYVADVLAFAAAYQHSQPERVVHLVPIVYPKPPAKVVATASPSASASRTSVPPTSQTSASTTATSSSSASSPTSAPPTSAPPTTAPPTTTTCSTAPQPTTTATTSAGGAPKNAASAIKSANPMITAGPTSAAPTRSPDARSSVTSSPSTDPTTCSPCPSPTATPTPTSSTSASATPTACPTTPVSTTTTTAPKSTPHLSPR